MSESTSKASISASAISVIVMGVILAAPGLGLIIWGTVGTDLTLLIPIGAPLLLVGVALVYMGIFTDVDAPMTVTTGAPAGGGSVAESRSSDDTLFVVGVILAILFPIIGFVLGVVLMLRDQVSKGLRLFVGSLGLTLLYGWVIFYR